MTDNELTLTIPEGLPYIEFTREFDAPAAALFRAYTDPALVAQWLGPDGYEMTIEEWELRDGTGRYRYLHRDPQGAEYRFHGVFHAARPNELIIQTFEWDGYPDVVSLEVMRLEDLGDGRSRLTSQSTYPSLESRDGMASSDMADGLTEGYRKLDRVLAAL